MTENSELLQQARTEVAKPTAKRFFERQGIDEKLNAANKLGGAPDFEVVFGRTLFDFLHIVRKETDFIPRSNLKSLPMDQRMDRVLDARNQLRQRAAAFMEDMRKIGMEDTIYPDVKTELPELVRNVDGVLVWTNGHPNYQLAKIERSKIQHLLETSTDSERDIVMDPLISRKKDEDTLVVLHQFASRRPEGEITVVIYDDSQGNFEKSDRSIQKFETETGRMVRRLFVWARTGRVEDSLTPEKAQEAVAKLPTEIRQNLRSATSFTEFVDIVKQYRSQSDGAILTLLDFDGALSDNRIMRLRQSQVFHDHLKRIIRDVALPEGSKEQIEEIEASLSALLAKEKK